MKECLEEGSNVLRAISAGHWGGKCMDQSVFVTKGGCRGIMVVGNSCAPLFQLLSCMLYY